MIFRFIYELSVGLLTITAIIILGEKGAAAFALLAPLPLILRMMKFKPDERELNLFYKTGNLTLLLIIGSMFTLGLLGQEQFFMDNWMFVTASALLVSHGLSGIIVFMVN